MADWCFWELKHWNQIQARSTDTHVETILHWPYPYFHRSFPGRFEALSETEKGPYLVFYVHFPIVDHIPSHTNGVVGSYTSWLSCVCLFQDRGMDCHGIRYPVVPSLHTHFNKTIARVFAIQARVSLEPAARPWQDGSLHPKKSLGTDHICMAHDSV